MKDEVVRSATFTLASTEGVSLFVYRWSPEAAPKAAVQIAHGLVEHAGRYARLAKALTDAGYDLLSALYEIAKPARQAHIPKQLPIYIIAGTRDPASANGKGLEQLLSAYHAAGLQRVACRFYPDTRHELFNETNREEVTRELLAWLDEATGQGNYSSRRRTGGRSWA